MGTIKVALIEDDKDIAAMYAQRFDMVGGFEVRIADNGESGLALLKTFTPDIILLDMMMPVMSGLETLTRLRKMPQGGSYKVIALTNMDDPDTTKAINKLGVVGHIVKANSSPGQVVERIKEAVTN